MAHKNKVKICGVYQIRNLVNGKLYIGSSFNIKQRWAKHKVFLNKNIHHSKYLQNSWNKYGKKNFIFEILETCLLDKTLILSLEQKYIDVQSDYNMVKVAGSPLGFKHGEEMKNKISKALTGIKRSNETKLKISKSNTGKTRSIAVKLKYSKNHNKSVSQFCPITFVRINSFESISIAALSTNISRSGIGRSAAGTRKTSGGYIWKYE